MNRPSIDSNAGNRSTVGCAVNLAGTNREVTISAGRNVQAVANCCSQLRGLLKPSAVRGISSGVWVGSPRFAVLSPCRTKCAIIFSLLDYGKFHRCPVLHFSRGATCSTAPTTIASALSRPGAP